MGAEVDGESVAPAQVGVVGQRGTQAGLPAAAGVPAALLEVGHGAQVQGAGRKQLLHEHAAGLHRVGDCGQEARGRGRGSGLLGPGPAPASLPTAQGNVCVCVCEHVCLGMCGYGSVSLDVNM